jgi:hypothetical protein
VHSHYEIGQRANKDGADLRAIANEYGCKERAVRQARLFVRRADSTTFKTLSAIRRTSDGLSMMCSAGVPISH